MPLTAPDWLARRGGSLKLGSDGRTWYLLINDEPQYSIVDVPVAGKHGYVIRQTINGRRLEGSDVFETAELAVAGALDNVRKTLGWD